MLPQVYNTNILCVLRLRDSSWALPGFTLKNILIFIFSD